MKDVFRRGEEFNKIVFKIFKIFFCSVVMSYNSPKCNLLPAVFQPSKLFMAIKNVERAISKDKTCFVYQSMVISKTY